MSDPIFTPEEIEKQAKDKAVTDQAAKDAAASAEAKKAEEAKVAAAKTAEGVLEGDAIPAEFRGRKATEVIQELQTKAMQAAQRPAPQNPAQPTGPKQYTQEELESLAFTNPLKATELVVQKMAAPLVDTLMQTATKVARDSVKDDDIYKRYAKEVDEVVNQGPPNLRGNPKMWEEAVNVVAGRHRVELAKEKETGSTALGGGNAAPPEAPKAKKLSEEQKAVAARFGMTEEQYIANM